MYTYNKDIYSLHASKYKILLENIIILLHMLRQGLYTNITYTMHQQFKCKIKLKKQFVSYQCDIWV